MPTHLLKPVLLCSALLMGLNPAWGQEQGRPLESFEAGPLDEQLELDLTPIPPGYGAIFVPALTASDTEPLVLVYHEGERLAAGHTGERIVVPPGTYEIRIGRGALEERLPHEVRVLDGLTTPVEPFYAAIRVDIVDITGTPVESDFVLARTNGQLLVEHRSIKDTAYTANPTWLVEPGRVVLALGDDPDAETDAVTLSVHAGEVLRYRIITDNGRMVRTELATHEIIAEESIWRLRWTVGADLNFSRMQRQVAAFNGDFLNASAFTFTDLGIDTGNHVALARLHIQAGGVLLASELGSDLPIQKINDELSFELLYNYRLAGIFGPYGRGRLVTAMFPTVLGADRPLDVTLERTDGTTESFALNAGDDLDLFNAFAPFIVQAGAGFGLAAVDNDFVSIVARVGFGMRQAWFGGGRFLSRVDETSATLVELQDNFDWGPEVTAIIGLRLWQYLSYEGTFDAFLPLELLIDGEFAEFVFRFDNVVSISLGHYVSLVYTFSLHRVDSQIEALQLGHNLSFRLQHTLF